VGPFAHNTVPGNNTVLRTIVKIRKIFEAGTVGVDVGA
jgi:hypothetical protein